MRSSKSRSRNKNRSRNPQSGGNVINRTFDSSGPEGKVRGTPAQIIDKYNQLARDAQLSGDRVAVETFQQHSEHYTRMLAAAQKEMDARQAQNNQQQNHQNAQQGGQGGGQQNGGGQGDTRQQNNQNEGRQNGGSQSDARSGDQQNTPQPDQANEAQQGGNRRRDRRPDHAPQDSGRDRQAPAEVIDTPAVDTSPVETPESRGAQEPEKPKRTRTRRKAPAKVEGQKTAGESGELPAFIDPAEPAAEG